MVVAVMQCNCDLSQSALFTTESNSRTHKPSENVAQCRIWMSYLNPIFWSVYGLIISQVGNLSVGCTLVSGDVVPVYEAVLLVFGYQ